MQKIKIKQQWSQDEKKLLGELFPLYSSKKWKMISQRLAELGFFRTELQCRQKWINFLDPSLNNQEWNSQELARLYALHDQHGTRWCFMQKELKRTQNRIKNRFYGTIRNYIRMVCKTLCLRHSAYNTEISKISPSLLNDLYNSQNVFDFMTGEVKKMIHRMKFYIDKKMLKNRIKDRLSLYKQLIGVMGRLFKKNIPLKLLDVLEKSSKQIKNQQSMKHAQYAVMNQKTGQFGEQKQFQKQQRVTYIKNNKDQQWNKTITIQSGRKLRERGEKQAFNINQTKQHNKSDRPTINKQSPNERYQIKEASIIDCKHPQINLTNQMNNSNQLNFLQGINKHSYYPFMMNGENFDFFNRYDLMMERVKFYNLMILQQQNQFLNSKNQQ